MLRPHDLAGRRRAGAVPGAVDRGASGVGGGVRGLGCVEWQRATRKGLGMKYIFGIEWMKDALATARKDQDACAFSVSKLQTGQSLYGQALKLVLDYETERVALAEKYLKRAELEHEQRQQVIP